MYEKPTLERFGTFRDLTQLGTTGGADLGPAFGLGCNAAPDALPFAACSGRS